MRPHLKRRALAVIEPLFILACFVGFFVACWFFALTFGGEPVICPLGSPEPSCGAYRQQLGAQP